VAERELAERAVKREARREAKRGGWAQPAERGGACARRSVCEAARVRGGSCARRSVCEAERVGEAW